MRIADKNAFATNHFITDQTVEAIVLAGRTRWKVENENNNTLKTKGYNLEYNFGHGKQYLSSLLATLSILSLLFHTLLELLDEKYRLIRRHLPTPDFSRYLFTRCDRLLCCYPKVLFSRCPLSLNLNS